MQRGLSGADDETDELAETCNSLCLAPEVASLCAEERSSILTWAATRLFANRSVMTGSHKPLYGPHLEDLSLSKPLHGSSGTIVRSHSRQFLERPTRSN
jgi:hypothetical protein